MAQIKLAEYTFDNSVGDCLPTLTPDTITMIEKNDTVDGTTTRRIIYIDDTTMPTKISFFDLKSLLTIEYLNVDSNINEASHMFHNCTNLTSINTYGWDTHNIETFSTMFYNCVALKSIDVSNFDMTNAVEMLSMFRNCSSLTTLDLSSWDTTTVTNMSYIFSGCDSLSSVNLNNINTSSVANMSYMFYGCPSLTSLDLSSFDTINTTNMMHMFYRCTGITTLDLTNFDTTNITGSFSYNMFGEWTSSQTVYIGKKWTIDTSSYSANFIRKVAYKYMIAKYTFDNSVADCLPTITGATTSQWDYSDEVDDTTTTRTIGTDEELTITNISFRDKTSLLTLDYLNFTNAITNATRMFNGCTALTSINTSNWDTSNVTSMNAMFNSCRSLASLDASNWDVGKVTNMSDMFYACGALTTLDLSAWNVSKVTNINTMFSACNGLTTLNVSGWDTSSLKSISSTFNSCTALTTLDLSSWKVDGVTNMSAMFRTCSALTTLNLSNWNTSKVSSMIYMFQGCAKLTTLDLSHFNVDGVTDMNNMFNGCSALTSLNTSTWNTSKVSNMSSMFQNCYKLVSLNLSHFNVDGVTNMSAMFNGCSALTSLNTSTWNTSKVTNMSGMFSRCIKLTTLDLSSFNTEKVTNTSNMFQNCTSLTKLDLSNWNTINTTTMSNMFSGATKLTDIGLLYSSETTINKITGVLPNIPKNIFYYDADPSQLTPVEGVTFKKYTMPTTIQLPPHIQLHSLPDGTKDEVDLATGILTRNVGYIMLSGDENISKSSLSNDSYSVFVIEDYNEHLGQQIKPLISNQFGYIENIGTQHYGKDVDKEGISYHTHVNGLRISISSRKSLTVEEFRHWLKQNKVEIMFNHKPTTEQLILNYNNSCDYGRILPTGICDKYDVVNSMYTQTMTSILLNGVNIWNDIADLGTVLKFTATGTTVGVDNLNMKGAGGLYCDNDLFPNINDDSDVEHCRVDEEGNKFYIYISKDRLMSPDLIGWQIWLQTNPFNMWYELEEHLIYTKPYEELDPTQARWDTMDCFRDGSIKYNTHTEDGLTIYPTLEYVAPSINNFEVPMLEPNTEYTMYAEGIGEGDTINLGGNDINFNNGTVYTSGENQWLRIDNNDSFYNVVVTKGDTTGEVVPYFEGMTSVENPKIITKGEGENESVIEYSSLKLRSLPNGVKDTLNVLTGEYIQRIGEREYQEGDLTNTNVLTNSVITTYELTEPIITKLDPQTLLAYTDGTINLSSDTGLLPTMTYSVPSTNVFNLPSIKTGTRYTLKYPSASGSISIGDITYKVTSPSMLFTTPLTLSGDASTIIFTDTNPQDVILIEGAYNNREIPYFRGLKSVSNPVITVVDGLTGEETKYRSTTDLELRSLPNGISDKLDIVRGKLTRVVGYRPYENGDENTANVWTDGYNTAYALTSPTITNVVYSIPKTTHNATLKLSSDDLIPQLNYRAASSNNFSLDLLQPNTTYTLYANTLAEGGYSLGGTHSGIFRGTEVISLGETTNNLLTFEGDLDLSNVMLIKGNSINATVPYFRGLKSVSNATFKIEGHDEEVNTHVLESDLSLRSLNNGMIQDAIDMKSCTLTQNLGEIRLIGAESWSVVSSLESVDSEYVLFGLTRAGIKDSKVTTATCDRFNHVYLRGELHAQECIYCVDNQIRICVKQKTINGNTINALKSWLNQNNTTVIYALATPVTRKLNSTWTTTPITSYDTQTSISTIVEDSLKPMINVTIAITTLEQTVSNLEEQNAQLERENLATMMALTEIYEMIYASAPMGTSKKQESEVTSVSYIGLVYAKLIKKGVKTIDQAPNFLKAEVDYALKQV